MTDAIKEKLIQWRIDMILKLSDGKLDANEIRKFIEDLEPIITKEIGKEEVRFSIK